MQPQYKCERQNDGGKEREREGVIVVLAAGEVMSPWQQQWTTWTEKKAMSIHSLNLWYLFYSCFCFVVNLNCVCLVLYLLIKMLAYLSHISNCTEFGECFVLCMAHTALCYVRTALLHMSMSCRTEFVRVRESWTSSLTDLKAGRLGGLRSSPR